MRTGLPTTHKGNKMTPNEQFELAYRIRTIICNRASGVFTYTNWSDDFAAKEIRTLPKDIKGMNGFHTIDPNGFTVEQLKALGFGLWDEESNLYLMPQWLLPFLPDEIKLGSISGGEEICKRDEIYNDSRFGCLAYGVVKAK